MSNDSGAEKLINTIMDEARAQAAQTEKQADMAIALTRKKLDDDRIAIKEEYARRAEAIKQDVIARAMTGAELEARKSLLAKKRGLADRAFSEAYKRICTLPDDKRTALLAKLLRTECEGGETIHPAPKENMADIVAAVSREKPGGLTLGEEDASIRNGFTIEGKGYFKNCSFTAVMDSARELYEGEVADILFK